jgi:hypothetical protein
MGVKPNHAWRHLFKSVARDVRMYREVEGFITGHRPKNSNAGNDYGDRWIKTLSAEIERYPRFKIAALDKSPAPHRRHHRTNAEIAAANAAREKRKVARSVGANKRVSRGEWDSLPRCRECAKTAAKQGFPEKPGRDL